MIESVRPFLEDLSDELVVEQDLVLWMYVIMNWVVLAAITFYALSTQDVKQETIDSLAWAFDLAIWAGIGIAFGRPLLIVSLKYILPNFGYEVEE